MTILDDTRGCPELSPSEFEHGEFEAWAEELRECYQSHEGILSTFDCAQLNRLVDALQNKEPATIAEVWPGLMSSLATTIIESSARPTDEINLNLEESLTINDAWTWSFQSLNGAAGFLVVEKASAVEGGLTSRFEFLVTKEKLFVQGGLQISDPADRAGANYLLQVKEELAGSALILSDAADSPAIKIPLAKTLGEQSWTTNRAELGPELPRRTAEETRGDVLAKWAGLLGSALATAAALAKEEVSPVLKPRTQPQAELSLLCEHCHSPNSPSAKFCRQCGKPVSSDARSIQCADCKGKNMPTAKFCRHCGKKL